MGKTYIAVVKKQCSLLFLPFPIFQKKKKRRRNNNKRKEKKVHLGENKKRL